MTFMPVLWRPFCNFRFHRQNKLPEKRPRCVGCMVLMDQGGPAEHNE
jgi:hypothetical protein